MNRNIYNGEIKKKEIKSPSFSILESLFCIHIGIVLHNETLDTTYIWDFVLGFN